jgi:agmatinase
MTVTILGVPWDERSSFMRGAALAPPAIRTALHSPSSNLCAESGVDLGSEPRLVDAGDLVLPAGGEALDAIDAGASRVLACGTRLLALGGDHAITYPIVRAQVRVHGPLTILHLDAHPDLYDAFEGDRYSHACPFARIMEEGLARRLVQVGLRTATPHQRAQAHRFGVEMIDMPAWRPDLDLDLGPSVYVSLDLDVLDPAFAPAVSHREPGGLSTREVTALLQRLRGTVIGADLVEFNPTRDGDGTTAMVAAKLLKELVAGML